MKFTALLFALLACWSVTAGFFFLPSGVGHGSLDGMVFCLLLSASLGLTKPTFDAYREM